MRGWNHFYRAFLALGILLLLGGSSSHVCAQANCLTYGQARKAGWFAGIKLRPAAEVKKAVEKSKGGKVESVRVCPGPIYKLTVFQKNGSVVTVTESAVAQ